MSWRIENEGGALRGVVTKDLPGERWVKVLTAAGCEVGISTSRDILSVDEIREAMGERCDGAIGQLTEPWAAELFEALKRAGGKAYSNYAVGFDNVDLAEATSRGIAVGSTPGAVSYTHLTLPTILLV